jgi:queuine tRNA-ribosyltransferase
MAYFEILKKVDPHPGPLPSAFAKATADKKEEGADVLRARNGVIHTAHGDVNTPAFLPIGTKGTVKAVTSEELKFWGAEMILANTYHLWQRPGDGLIYKAGGLHKFMNWKGPIFTDSGGFQVQSLAKFKKVMEAGVLFNFDMDGRQEILSPEKSIQIQANLGSDICLILDDFSGVPFEYGQSKISTELTNRWAERAIREHLNIMKNGDPINPGQKLWGIVQGSNFKDLRKISAEAMVNFDFEGFAIGGIATVDEPFEEMMKAVEWSITHLPEEKPRHLLGVGTPYDIVQVVARGCDTFDCVIPTREARHGRLYIAARVSSPSPSGRGARGEGSSDVEGYATIDIRLEKFKEDFTPVDNTCDCYLCLNHTKSYLRHLFAAGEPLATRLASMHNLRFYLNLMKKIRTAIQYDYFDEMAENYKDYTKIN